MAENLQRGGHFRQFVLAADLHLFFQLSCGHAAHTLRQHIDTAQKHPANKEPANEQRADDADDGDDDKQGAAGGDGPVGCLGRFLGGDHGCRHQAVHLGHQAGGLGPAQGQEAALFFGQLQFRAQHHEDAILGQPQLLQPAVQRLQPLFQFGVIQAGHVAVDTGDGRLESFLLRFNQRRVEDAENAGKLLERDVGVGLQCGQVTVGAEFFLGEMDGVGGDNIVHIGAPGNDVKILVVDGGYQDLFQLGAELHHIVQQCVGLLAQLEGPPHVDTDGLDVVVQPVGVPPDALGADGVGIIQGLEMRLDGGSRGGDFRPHPGQFFRRGRGGQTRRGGDQGAAELGHAEGGLHLRHAAFVDPGLGLAHPLEAEPAYEAGGHGQRHGHAEGGE